MLILEEEAFITRELVFAVFVIPPNTNEFPEILEDKAFIPTEFVLILLALPPIAKELLLRVVLSTNIPCDLLFTVEPDAFTTNELVAIVFPRPLKTNDPPEILEDKAPIPTEFVLTLLALPPKAKELLLRVVLSTNIPCDWLEILEDVAAMPNELVAIVFPRPPKTNDPPEILEDKAFIPNEFVLILLALPPIANELLLRVVPVSYTHLTLPTKA